MKRINYVLISSTVALALMATAPLLASANNDSENASAQANAHVGFSIGSLFHFGGDTKNNDEQGVQDENDNATTTTTTQKENDNNDKGDHATSTDNGSAENDSKTTVGVVSAVSSSTITLNAKGGVIYSITTAGATISGPHGTSIALANIQVGDTLMVKGVKTGTTISAQKIFDGALEIRNFVAANGAVGAGIVTSINGSTFTIKPLGTQATTTVTTNGSTTFQLNGQPASSTALAVGSKVLLTGTTTSQTSIGASIVNIFSAGFGFFKHLFFH